MSMPSSLRYGLIVGLFIVLDRLTKGAALRYCALDCTFNRGISWGMLNYAGSGFFEVITLLIILITAVLGVYAYRRMMQGYPVWGELLIIGGSLSNIIDRFMYGGVVDFIEVRVGSWIGPAFNLADSMVVVGVAVMAYELLYTTNKNS